MVGRYSTGCHAGRPPGRWRDGEGREGPHTKKEKEKNNSNSKMAQSREFSFSRANANNAAGGDVFTGRTDLDKIPNLIIR